MRKEHPTLQDLEMNETRLATMRRVLADRPLLNQLREEDREALIRLYMENLQRWEDRKNG